jgi:Uncharacterized conserved protein
MAAYLIGDIEITDAAGYDEYRKTVGASITAFGGRFLVRGGVTLVTEGEWHPKRVVVVEFPTMERLQAWYASKEYAPALALRKRAAVSNLVMVEGVA